MIWQKEIMLGSYKRGIHLITNELIDNLTNSHPSIWTVKYFFKTYICCNNN